MRAKIKPHLDRYGRRRNRRPIAPAVLMTIGVLGYAGFHLAERFPEHFAPLVKITAFNTVSGPVTHVRDGDTIEVSSIPIRFGSLDCPERGARGGSKATQRMRSLVSGQTLTCYLNGRQSYDRRIGSCQLDDGRDLGGIMIDEGLCRRYW